MSNSIAQFAYGVDLTWREELRQRVEGVSWVNEIDTCHGDLYFWGELIDSVSNGAGGVPSLPDEVTRRVEAEYEEIPDDVRADLPEPSFQVIVYLM